MKDDDSKVNDLLYHTSEQPHTLQPEKEIHSTIRKLIWILADAFEEIGKNVDRLELERIGCIVHQVMSARYRQYHTLNHIFKMITDDMKPMAKLAIIFHDLVYLNVD